ncbi:formylglycine-generating enzyme family protein [Candidatus Pantoea formicae]|uniref:formylglycine-generating enzyme family protein n=1 Tax=Candidatus Pantoea formicae TaxID=2608355 RepID=UPI003EDA30A4
MNLKVLALCLIVTGLIGCDDSKSKTGSLDIKENKDFVKKINENLVYVPGGEFMMGDFGVKHYKEHLPLDANSDSKPLHNVELDGFSISKYKTTNEEFQYFLKVNGLPIRKTKNIIIQRDWDGLNKIKNMPAHADWYEAEKYCAWLSNITHLPYSLATEAQWEYAARSQGQYRVVGTDDGTWKVGNDGRGINIGTTKDRKEWAKMKNLSFGSLTTMPVNKYPPNPLGLFDMSGNGSEWVKDWYDPKYYSHSPVKNPQGPENPTYKNYNGKYTKVVRNIDLSNPGKGITVSRSNESPDNNGDLPMSFTFRCVVNSPSLVQ